jgi:formylglycine-generating enzyme required for sulfatase activity
VRQANFDATQASGVAVPGPRLGRTTAVGSYPGNAWGLYDLHGNVWQWCGDWHDEDYFQRSPGRDPPGPERGPYGERGVRGGAWDAPAGHCRSANRGRVKPELRNNGLGFRVVCVLPGAPE